MHYFKRNIGDYHKKAGRLSMLEHGAYTLLIDSCYDRERFPTLSEAYEWTWARTDEEKDAVLFVLQKFFVLIDNKYTQSRIVEELDNYHSNSETNKRIAMEREAKRRTNRERTVNEPPPNHKPITKNQEPLTTTKYTPPINGDLLREWKVIRKNKRAGEITERVWNAVEREASLAGITTAKAIELCCESSWQTFKAVYIKNSKGSVQEARLDTVRQIMGGLHHETHRQTFDIDGIRTIEGDGACFPEAPARLREPDAL